MHQTAWFAQFQILFIIEKTETSISYHASHVLYLFGGPIQYLFACINAISCSSMDTRYWKNFADPQKKKKTTKD